jgi:hypothetical protein
MSKRDLKKYLAGLKKEQLEEQIIELYEKFSPIKVYYDLSGIFSGTKAAFQVQTKS